MMVGVGVGVGMRVNGQVNGIKGFGMWFIGLSIGCE